MNNNIFINCPYDTKYKGLFDAIIFTVIVLGFNPQVALQETDSSDIRIDKIIRLIEKSKYSIHDLSRIKAEKKGEVFRLNMSFELGIDYGAKRFNDKHDKKLLILEKDKYSYLKAISDISGMDIEAHNNSSDLIIECVRNWLVKNADISNVPAPNKIASDYSDRFLYFLFKKAKNRGYKEDECIDKILYPEYIEFVKEWLKSRAVYAKIVVQS
ncbi:MAG: hypothetical protein JW811_07910 [Clostridiales bacterium]|nr:hypothetical protein [Clostridiales bacterium]